MPATRRSSRSPHLRAGSASPPPDDDTKGSGDDDSPRWANVGRWRHHSKLAPFFKRPKEIQQRLSERGRKMLRATVTGDPTGAMRVRDYVKMPRTIQTIDKVSFTLGVVGLMVTQFVATEHPRRFWAYYALTAPPIFAYRVIQYSMIKYHYFLIDFCYYANVACFVQILALPSSPALFRSVFAYANGPILMAIPLWRNSLVFHSHDKVQSVYIHCVPAILTWCTRWYGQEDWDLLGLIRWRSSESSGTSRVRLSAETLGAPMDVLGMAMEFYAYPVAGYLLWQICYLLKTELWDVKRLDEDPELVTSLRWLANDYKAPVTRWALRTSRRVGLFARDELFDASSLKTKFVFVSLQLIYTVITFLPIPLCYVSKVFHTSLMLAAFLSCIWNGAEYYIDIFSRRYAKKFEEGSHGGSVRDEDEADALVANGRG